MSLQRKVILFGGIGLLVIFGLLAFLGVRALEESTKRTLNERVLTAEMVAQGVDDILTSALTDLERFAGLSAVDLEDRDTDPEIAALDHLRLFSGVFTSLFLLDKEGNLLYLWPEDSDHDTSALRSRENVGRTLEDGGKHVSTVSPAPPNQRPELSLSVGIRNSRYDVVGLIGGDIDISKEEVSVLLPPGRLGAGAYTEVVSEQGLVMASTRQGGNGGAREETEYAAHFVNLIEAGEAAQETCYRCHETETGVERREDVLAFAPLKTFPGGVAIRQPKEDALAPTRKLERDMLLIGAPILVVGLALSWMGARGLIRPVRQLTRAAQHMAAGDLDRSITSGRKDELGALAGAFEDMRKRLRQSLAEREERAREAAMRAEALSVLNSVATTVSQSLELEQTLDNVLDRLLGIMRLDAAAILLRDEETGDLVLKAGQGASKGYLLDVSRLRGEEASPVEPVAFTAQKLGPNVSWRGQLRSFVDVPLVSKGKALGSMIVGSREDQRFTCQDIELLTAVGRQIGVGIDNAMLFQETQQREEEARALYLIGMEVSRLLDLDRILRSVVHNAHQLLHADTTSLALVEETTQELYFRAITGEGAAMVQGLRLRVGQGMLGRVVSLGSPVVCEDYLSDLELAHVADVDSIVRKIGLRAHLGVPVKIGEKVIGGLLVAQTQRRRFTEREVDLLVQLANQAAVAIENARLYSQVQDMAVLEERDRIAREMHDSLGQVLAYLALKSRSVQDLISTSEREKALTEIEDMRKVARDAYDEVREGILGLRAGAPPEVGLLPALEEFLAGFRSRSGIPVTVLVDDERATQFPSRVGVQLVRVVQEALTNVRKHAQATSAEVRFALEGNEARITIADDGVGFDPSRQRQNHLHFGLETMRERAETVGATFAIDSSPGGGTRVTVRVPLPDKKE